MPSLDPRYRPGVVTEEPLPVNLTRRIVTSVLVIGLVLFGAFKGFQHFAAMRKASAKSDAAALAPLVRVVEAKRIDHTEMLRGFGRARPMRTATVVAEVEGVVRSLDPELEAGRLVEPLTETTKGGDGPELPVLVTIDDRDLDDRLERARAEVTAAEADLKRLGTQLGSLRERLAVTERELEAAQRELERIAPLVPKTISRSELDAQQIQVALRERGTLQLEAAIRQHADDVAASEARLISLRRAVALALRAKERAQVRAPFAGRIEIRHVEVGERVKTGDPLFTIVDLSRMEVPVALPAGRYDEVETGAAATLSLPEQDKPLWTGTVARKAPTIDTERRVFFAYLVVEGSPGANVVTPGAHLVATVEGFTHQGVMPIPRRAFLTGRLFVATPKDDGTTATVHERAPQVTRYLMGYGLVKDGLEAGELVLITNLESVAEGSTVRIAPEPVALPTKGTDSEPEDGK